MLRYILGLPVLLLELIILFVILRFIIIDSKKQKKMNELKDKWKKE
jgi:hypothetical protein